MDIKQAIENLKGIKSARFGTIRDDTPDTVANIVIEDCESLDLAISALERKRNMSYNSEKSIRILENGVGVLENYLKNRPCNMTERCFESELIKDMLFVILVLKEVKHEDESLCNFRTTSKP